MKTGRAVRRTGKKFFLDWTATGRRAFWCRLRDLGQKMQGWVGMAQAIGCDSIDRVSVEGFATNVPKDAASEVQRFICWNFR
jgi:hypothetical protein